MMKLLALTFCFILALTKLCSAQSNYNWPKFSHSDSLRGTLDEYRAAYDVQKYDITINPNFSGQTISGSCFIYFKWVKYHRVFRFDLDTTLRIKFIHYQGKKMSWKRDGSAVYVKSDKLFKTNPKEGSIFITYEGRPRIAKHAPWDGGLVWDSLGGKPWLGTTCEGEGASLWYPCKDHLSDKADTTVVTIITPNDLMGIANGNLVHKQAASNGRTAWRWQCSYPAPNYTIAFYVGDYEHFSDSITRKSLSKPLSLDYYVIKGNLDKARKHFEQVKPMLAAYEHYLGPYPFWKDGYALVETPYWGMEHQSAIAYGNKYKNNEFGFDFIIIHESGHEYFGNSLSADDHANMFIQEGFCTYLETLYLEYTQNKAQSEKWLLTQRKKVMNTSPMAAPAGVNYLDFRDNDIYYKGACMLHTIRHMVGDSLFFQVLRNYYEKSRYQAISMTTYQERFIAPLGNTIQALSTIYLQEASLPKLEYYFKDKDLFMRLVQAKSQKVIIPIKVGDTDKTISINSEWQLIGQYPTSTVSLGDPNYLLHLQQVKP